MDTLNAASAAIDKAVKTPNMGGASYATTVGTKAGQVALRAHTGYVAPVSVTAADTAKSDQASQSDPASAQPPDVTWFWWVHCCLVQLAVAIALQHLSKSVSLLAGACRHIQ
jgi:hypothetical protein